MVRQVSGKTVLLAIFLVRICNDHIDDIELARGFRLNLPESSSFAASATAGLIAGHAGSATIAGPLLPQ